MGLFRSYGNDNRGYSHGSIDVITAINLFFKFLLISPILLLAMYVAITMMKHVIFHGIPSMNKPTEEQQQRLREADAQIGMQPEQTQVQPVQPVQPVQSTVVEHTPSVKTTLTVPQVRSTIVVPDERAMVRHRAEQFRKYCLESWLPKYGNNPNGADSPCHKFRSAPITSSRLNDALNSVR